MPNSRIVRWLKDNVVDRSGLRRATQYRRCTRKAADAKYRQAMAEGLRGTDLWNARIIAQGDAEVDLAEAEYDEVKTQIILDRARHNEIPIPPRSADSEFWYRSVITNEFYLTTDGIFKLNADMRRLRNDIWQFRIQFAVVIVGVIGAISGLLAVIAKLN